MTTTPSGRALVYKIVNAQGVPWTGGRYGDFRQPGKLYHKLGAARGMLGRLKKDDNGRYRQPFPYNTTRGVEEAKIQAYALVPYLEPTEYTAPEPKPRPPDPCVHSWRGVLGTIKHCTLARYHEGPCE